MVCHTLTRNLFYPIPRTRRLMYRWRNTIKATSEHAPEFSVTQHTSYLVEEPIYLVWILSNCIVLIVEISILHLVVNMRLLMVSLFSLISFPHTPLFRLTPVRACAWNSYIPISLLSIARLANSTANIQAHSSERPSPPYSSRHTPNSSLYPSTPLSRKILNVHPLLDRSPHPPRQRQ